MRSTGLAPSAGASLALTFPLSYPMVLIKHPRVVHYSQEQDASTSAPLGGSRMLDHRVGPGKYQAFVAILEANQERWMTGLASNFDDFAAAIRLSDVVRFHY